MCIKKAYAKNITIQSTLVKNSFQNGSVFIQSIDAFLKKYETSSQLIETLVSRTIIELNALWDSERDKKLQLIFHYILYSSQYITIEQTHATIANNQLSLGYSPRDIWDYLYIIDYLVEEDIWKYINDLDYKEKEKLAKKIVLTNEDIIYYFSFEERDVSNASAIEKNIYYRLLIFYEYLENNPAVWAEYKAKRNEKQ